MTRHTLHARIALLAVCCLLVGLASVPASAGATQAANDTTLAVADATVDPDEDARARVSLAEAPAGLAGYEVTLELRSAGVANVTGASYPDAYQPTTDPDIGPEGRTITLEAADLAGQVEPGATNVTLATVNVSGVESGATRLVVTDLQVDADNGSRVAPSLDSGAVTVGSADPPAPTTEAAAAEPTTDDADRNEASAGNTAVSPAVDEGSTGTTTGAGPGLGIATALLALATLALLARTD